MIKLFCVGLTKQCKICIKNSFSILFFGSRNENKSLSNASSNGIDSIKTALKLLLLKLTSKIYQLIAICARNVFEKVKLLTNSSDRK